MCFWCGVDDDSREEGVLEKTLDRLDEERQQIPCVSGMRQGCECVKDRRIRQALRWTRVVGCHVMYILYGGSKGIYAE